MIPSQQIKSLGCTALRETVRACGLQPGRALPTQKGTSGEPDGPAPRTQGIRRSFRHASAARRPPPPGRACTPTGVTRGPAHVGQEWPLVNLIASQWSVNDMKHLLSHRCGF